MKYYYEYRERTKENAINNYITMTLASWTFDRMTDEEKKRCIESLKYAKVAGAYNTRWEILHSIYYAFLLGLGYTGGNWREPATSNKPLF